MGWAIRQLDPSEAALVLPLLEQVQAIHAAAHPDLFKADVDRGELLALLRSMLEQEGMTGLVAQSPNGSVVGYALFGIEVRDPSPIMHGLRLGVLHHVSVDRDWRRLGIASALIDEAKARLRAMGVPRWRTVFGDFNEPSAGLMRKSGLRPLNIVAEGEP